MGRKLDGKRTRRRTPAALQHGQHGHRRRPNLAARRAIRARLAALERLTLAHPELAAVAVPSSAMGSRWGYLAALADRWEARAVALGLLGS